MKYVREHYTLEFGPSIILAFGFLTSVSNLFSHLLFNFMTTPATTSSQEAVGATHIWCRYPEWIHFPNGTFRVCYPTLFMNFSNLLSLTHF